MCSKGVCTEDLLVVDVAYVNNYLVLLQAIEKLTINTANSENVAMQMQGPTQMHYTEIPVLQKFATCARGAYHWQFFGHVIRSHANFGLIPCQIRI